MGAGNRLEGAGNRLVGAGNLLPVGLDMEEDMLLVKEDILSSPVGDNPY